ncbi:ATP-grasp domain-containing protein, partial [Candidatus Peregrinibacteria bacterium]|nr:ATP-grasp domain-containing protein [Candidatus Peregrinibacteria bacterium]
ESFIELKKGKKNEYVKQASKTSLDSYITFLIMENKKVSKYVLRQAKISVPEGKEYTDILQAEHDYPLFKGKKIVVKPKDTNFGIGITILEKGEQKKYSKALRLAFKNSHEVLIEEFIEGIEYRFLVIGKKVHGIVERIPANIIGDGKHSIKELINNKNFIYRNLYPIKMGEYEKDFLSSQKLTFNSIPKKGRQVFLRKNTNVSTGGDAIDKTDEIPQYFKTMAVKAAASAKAKICGVDMIIPNLEQKNYSVIEINFNPALEMHAFPHEGKKRKVAKPVLDLLGFK